MMCVGEERVGAQAPCHGAVRSTHTHNNKKKRSKEEEETQNFAVTSPFYSLLALFFFFLNMSLMQRISLFFFFLCLWLNSFFFFLVTVSFFFLYTRADAPSQLAKKEGKERMGGYPEGIIGRSNFECPSWTTKKRYKTPSREPNNSLRGGVGEDEVSVLFVAQTQFAVALFLSPFFPCSRNTGQAHTISSKHW